MQKYFFYFITYFFTFYTAYSMDSSFVVKEYPCKNFQQAYFSVHDETKVILNTKEQCSIVSLIDPQQEEILFKHQGKNHYLVAHPQNSLIALSNDKNKNITIYDYMNNVSKSISTPTNRSGLVSVGKFNPHHSAFYYDTGNGLFYFDYGSSPISAHKLNIFKDCSSAGMNRPLDYCVTFDAIKNVICIVTHDARIIVCNEEDIWADKLSEKSETYELALKKCDFHNAVKCPFFFEYTLQGALLICAVQNYGPCREIVLFNTCNAYQIEKTIKAKEKTNFVHMALHPNGMILATWSLPGMELQFWNIKTGAYFSQSIPLGKKEIKRNFHFFEFFMSYSPSGKKIIVSEIDDDTYKIIQVPDTILTELYQDIMPAYQAGLIALQRVGLSQELNRLIIEKILELYRSL